MPTARANGIDIFYDSFGRAQDPALLLVMGLGAQMIRWDESFCEKLAARGFHVIRFDNRDTGLSSKIEDGPAPNVAAAMTGDTSSASYTLWDMAADAIGLLDTLGIGKAHIVGASMGGMIVQSMAIRHPERILTMTSIMSTTGNPAVGQATPEAMAILLGPMPATKDEAVAGAIRAGQALGGEFPIDEAKLASTTAREWDRSHNPAGFARQILAIMAGGDRTAELANVKTPTLVIHGAADPLVTLSGGQATADAIPGAELLVVPKMGHSLPAEIEDQVVEAIARHAQKAPATVG